mgnify:CR=1 FL=1
MAAYLQAEGPQVVSRIGILFRSPASDPGRGGLVPQFCPEQSRERRIADRQRDKPRFKRPGGKLILRGTRFLQETSRRPLRRTKGTTQKVIRPVTIDASTRSSVKAKPSVLYHPNKPSPTSIYVSRDGVIPKGIVHDKTYFQPLQAMDPRLKPAGMTIFLTFVIYYDRRVYPSSGNDGISCYA